GPQNNGSHVFGLHGVKTKDYDARTVTTLTEGILTSDASWRMHAAVLELPTNQQRDWLAAFGAAAVFVGSAPTRSPAELGATQDLKNAVAAERRLIGRDAQLARVWWVSSLEAALELARAAGPVPGSNTTIEAIERRIREAARRRRIPLAEHAPTLERART